MIRHRHLNINVDGDGARAAACATTPWGNLPLSRRCPAADQAAPGEGEPLQPSSGAVVLPDIAHVYLSIVAAHDRVTPEEFLTRAICARLDAIGISRALDLAQGALDGALGERAFGPASARAGETSPGVRSDARPAADHLDNIEYCGGRAEVARPSQAQHKPEVAGSNPAPATSITPAEEGREEVPSGLLPVPRAPP